MEGYDMMHGVVRLWWDIDWIAEDNLVELRSRLDSKHDALPKTNEVHWT